MPDGGKRGTKYVCDAWNRNGPYAVRAITISIVIAEVQEGLVNACAGQGNPECIASGCGVHIPDILRSRIAGNGVLSCLCAGREDFAGSCL